MLSLKEERRLLKEGYGFIGALDEAGRGPLAGPVVAACVLITEESIKNIPEDFRFIDDSKKLTIKKREEAFEIINANFETGIGICDHITIDRVNILQASFLAMKKAIGALRTKPEFIILDGGFPIPHMSTKQKFIVSGDSLVFSIAAASVLAKVTRDRIMREMHELYPQYSFDKHKGYGTKLHLERLTRFGPSPIHRKSFAPVKRLLG